VTALPWVSPSRRRRTTLARGSDLGTTNDRILGSTETPTVTSKPMHTLFICSSRCEWPPDEPTTNPGIECCNWGTFRDFSACHRACQSLADLHAAKPWGGARFLGCRFEPTPSLVCSRPWAKSLVWDFTVCMYVCKSLCKLRMTAMCTEREIRHHATWTHASCVRRHYSAASLRHHRILVPIVSDHKRWIHQLSRAWTA